MTDIVLENEGIIDKYLGDAIMAEFGAPLYMPDHADRAVGTGLKMLYRLKELRKEWSGKGLPEMRCRVGINTGTMITGNMGSHQVFDFTVIGDAVNLASRLEGANKNYNTYLMISEYRVVGGGIHEISLDFEERIPVVEPDSHLHEISGIDYELRFLHPDARDDFGVPVVVRSTVPVDYKMKWFLMRGGRVECVIVRFRTVVPCFTFVVVQEVTVETGDHHLVLEGEVVVRSYVTVILRGTVEDFSLSESVGLPHYRYRMPVDILKIGTHGDARGVESREADKEDEDGGEDDR